MSCPHVCSGALLRCSFGMAPASLNVLPTNRMLTGGMPAATIMDHAPFVNIAPFGMCMSLANPQVAAATAAALGVLTPMPCQPMTFAPWVPGGPPVFLLGDAPALGSTASLMCAWAGVISITLPGQFTELVP